MNSLIDYFQPYPIRSSIPVDIRTPRLRGDHPREDADLIHEFCEEREATRHTTGATSLVISKCLTQSVRCIAPYKGCTTQDIIKAINAPGHGSAGKRVAQTGCTLFP